MRFISIKKAIAWNFLGWFIFGLICLIIALIIMGKFSDGSFSLIDKLFDTW
ncbi:MAG: hypothetical protein KAK00_09130 [Nanoarchaeota archaeon]|nr:hypothetical protein [Nanoarchaeota archaeon]